MDLKQWKKLELERQRGVLKSALREGKEIQSENFTQQELTEMMQEVEIETFCEAVEWDEEIELTEAVDGLEEVQDFIEFVPNHLGEEMDLEIEIDTEMYDLNESTLEKICEVVCAESFIVIEESKRAKVVFKRAKGKIQKRKACGKGMRLQGNRCVPQAGGQKAKNRLRGIKIKRARRALGAGKKKRAALKARITKRRVSGRARNFSGMKR